MMNLSNYRLKINLENFYNDQRKLSYIYVDTDKIINVFGLRRKISDVFNINRPFHLFTDENFFLPLNEDIRIIDRNDTITIRPESFDPINLEITNQSVSEKFQTQMNSTNLQKIENTASQSNTSSQSEESTSDTDNEVKVDETKQCQANCNQNKSENITDSSSLPKKKRKRGRRGRKNQNRAEKIRLPQVTENSNKVYNQSTSNHCENDTKNISTPKHLKFNWEETTNRNGQSNGNCPKHLPKAKPIVRSNESANLTPLLGLKNSKSPLSFVSKKVKPNSPTSSKSMSNNPEKNQDKKMNEFDSPIKDVVNNDNVDYSKINPLDYPAYSSEFTTDDVLAFRTLKMAENYSPTVSGYIIARVISKDSVPNNYVLKILEGHHQMKTPNGKFSLPNDEETDDEDINLDKNKLVTLNASHFVEPRLIYRVKHN